MRINVTNLANELKQPPEPVFEAATELEQEVLMSKNLHDPVAMRAAFDSLPFVLRLGEQHA